MKQDEGSVVADGFNAPASMWRCCAEMDPETTGTCSDGCCDRVRCKACGKRWTEEWAS